MERAEALILRQLAVRVTGNAAAARTLVFSHGFGTDQHEWDSLQERLQGDYRCVLMDHAGAGQSDPHLYDPRRYGEILAHAQDLVRVLKALDIGGAVLVGHSAGAMIGMLAAVEAPECFSRLVLIGASACYQNLEDYEGGFKKEDLVQLYSLMMQDYQQWIAQFVGLATQKEQDDSLHTYLAHMLARLAPDAALVRARAVLESDYRDWVGLVTQPTLLLQARSDPVVPRSAAEFLRQAIPECQIQTLEASGHFAFLEVPDAVASAIRGFAPSG